MVEQLHSEITVSKAGVKEERILKTSYGNPVKT